MNFTLSREALLKPLQMVAGVVERRQTLPILSNVLFRLEGNRLSFTGTDLEVEIIGFSDVVSRSDAGQVTVSARKILDICRALPEGANLDFTSVDAKLVVTSGRSNFSLATLPANEFPSVDQSDKSVDFVVCANLVKGLIESTAFAMAQQDVRYYLNGMLWEVTTNQLRAVATDGHRLALCDVTCDINVDSKVCAILPRKAVAELSRLLGDDDIRVSIGSNHIRVTASDFCFTSKLVDGAYPDYDRVVPRGGDKVAVGDRELLKQAFSRTAILSYEKYRGVQIQLQQGVVSMVANNPDQEEAREEVEISYSGQSLEMGFNVGYILDVLNVLKGKEVRFTISDSNSSVLIENPSVDSKGVYVVMPMCL